MEIDSAIKGLLNYCKNNKEVLFLTSMIDQYPELSERNIKEIKYFAKLNLKGMLELAKTLKGADKEEINSALSNLWFEFRSQWIRHNAVNNYNIIMYGDAEPLFVLQSSVLSYYIEAIEEFIPQESLDTMKEIMIKIQYNP